MRPRHPLALVVGLAVPLTCWVSLAAAPRGKDAPPPEFPPVCIDGHWDGDRTHEPWLREDGGCVVWNMVWGGLGDRDVCLGPLTTDTHLRVTGRLVGVNGARPTVRVDRVEELP